MGSEPTMRVVRVQRQSTRSTTAIPIRQMLLGLFVEFSLQESSNRAHRRLASTMLFRDITGLLLAVGHLQLAMPVGWRCSSLAGADDMWRNYRMPNLCTGSVFRLQSVPRGCDTRRQPQTGQDERSLRPLRAPSARIVAWMLVFSTCRRCVGWPVRGGERDRCSICPPR